MTDDRRLTTNPTLCSECGENPANTGGEDAALCVECDPKQGGT